MNSKPISLSKNRAVKVEKEANYMFLLDYLATFTGDLPTQMEVEGPANFETRQDHIHVYNTLYYILTTSNYYIIIIIYNKI